MRPRNNSVFSTSLFVATVVGIVLIYAVSGSAYAQSDQTRISANGAFGGGFTCDQNGDCSNIDVSRDYSRQSVTTNLTFRVERRNPVTGILTYTFGTGTIPKEDLVSDMSGLAAHRPQAQHQHCE